MHNTTAKHSNLVGMGNDSRRIIHANKFRKYYTRAMSCRLIGEEDEEFKISSVV